MVPYIVWIKGPGCRAIIDGKYIWKFSPNHPRAKHGGMVPEHRLLIEEKIGRYLKPTETIHHKDGDPQNNRLSNLMLCNKQYHLERFHEDRLINEEVKQYQEHIKNS